MLSSADVCVCVYFQCYGIFPLYPPLPPTHRWGTKAHFIYCFLDLVGGRGGGATRGCLSPHLSLCFCVVTVLAVCPVHNLNQSPLHLGLSLKALWHHTMGSAAFVTLQEAQKLGCDITGWFICLWPHRKYINFTMIEHCIWLHLKCHPYSLYYLLALAHPQESTTASGLHVLYSIHIVQCGSGK